MPQRIVATWRGTVDSCRSVGAQRLLQLSHPELAGERPRPRGLRRLSRSEALLEDFDKLNRVQLLVSPRRSLHAPALELFELSQLYAWPAAKATSQLDARARALSHRQQHVRDLPQRPSFFRRC